MFDLVLTRLRLHLIMLVDVVRYLCQTGAMRHRDNMEKNSLYRSRYLLRQSCSQPVPSQLYTHFRNVCRWRTDPSSDRIPYTELNSETVKVLRSYRKYTIQLSSQKPGCTHADLLTSRSFYFQLAKAGFW